MLTDLLKNYQNENINEIRNVNTKLTMADYIEEELLENISQNTCQNATKKPLNEYRLKFIQQIIGTIGSLNKLYNRIEKKFADWSHFKLMNSVIDVEFSEINEYREELPNFALKHIQKAQNPQQYLEHKFAVAYNRLKRLCPQIDVAKELAPYCRKRYEKNIKAEEKEDLLANMSNLGFAINTKNKIELTPPSRIKRLQSPKIFGKEKEFRNSSPLLFLLLAAMIYALLKYF